MTQALFMEIYRVLAERWGEGSWWPSESPFETAAGAILTQNTNWRNVEKALVNLKDAEMLSPVKIADADAVALQALIRPAGFHRQKAERLRLLSCWLLEHGGDFTFLQSVPVDTARRMLLALKGVGAETADAILLYAADVPTFVVDAYTFRIFSRIGVVSRNRYEEIRQLFMNNIPEDTLLYKSYHGVIVEHAKAVCAKRSPRCVVCPLLAVCRRVGVEDLP